MKIRAFLMIVLMSMILAAGDQEKEVNVMVMTHGDGDGVRIEFTDENGQQEMHIVHNDGEVTFDPSELEVGDSRTLTLDNGSELVVSRTEAGLSLNIDGKDMELLTLHEGGVHGAHGNHVVVHGDGHTSSANFIIKGDDDGGEHVFIHKNGVDTGKMLMELGAKDSVNISGLGDLSEEVRDQIIQALRDAGVEKEINFSDMHIMHSTTGNVWISDDGTTHTCMKVYEFKSEDGNTTKVKVVQEKEKK